MSNKVELKKVYKSFQMYSKQSEKLFDILSFNRKKKISKTFLAVRDVSLEIGKGEVVGVIGLNGSGKSTLSNLLAKIYRQTSGEIDIDGETSLIAISAGLNASLSGFENIELKCLMHGLNKKEIEEITPDIIDFADIGDHIYQPVKNYSSGMKSRLGFAISVHTNPDILVIDEALSVGDSTFANKSLKKMKEFKEKGKTIFFISHSISQVRDFCDKVIWMHYGELKEIGESTKVIKNYNNFIDWFNSLSGKEKKDYKSEMLNNQMQDIKHLEEKNNLNRTDRIKEIIANSIAVVALLSMITLMFLNS